MKAIVYHPSGSPDVVLRDDVEMPTVGDDEVLIKVRAASVNPLDCHLVNHPFMRRMVNARGKQGVNRPGRDLAGEVEAVGNSVTRFKAGDAVFGACGGAFAEYACARESALARKPDVVSFEQAAAVPVAGLTAMQGMRDKANVQPGQRVLINGAAGGVGTFAVQIGKWLRAEVTGVCGTKNVELVRSIGADNVIDYTQQDFTSLGQRYDFIFDLVANHPFSALRRSMNPNGIYIGAGMLGRHASMLSLLPRLLTELVMKQFVSQRFVSLMAKVNTEDLEKLGDLIATGEVTPVIDRQYSLREAPEALRYVGTAHARGKVIIGVARSLCGGAQPLAEEWSTRQPATSHIKMINRMPEIVRYS